jgi:ribosomal protein L12E/L44/L45/RPP1/RPP2
VSEKETMMMTRDNTKLFKIDCDLKVYISKINRYIYIKQTVFQTKSINQMYSTKLSTPKGYNIDNMIFSKPETGNIPGSVPKLTFKRIKINTKNTDGTVGDLIFETPPDLFSFGLQENREMGTGNINGYVLPICLWNKNGATDDEKCFISVLDQVVEKCKQHLLAHKDDIEKYNLEASDLKNLNPLYWKKEKGKIVEGKGPVLYIKTLMSKKNEKISTVFINEETNEEIDPFEVLNKYCFVRGAVKIESLFIGKTISLQMKLYEVVVRLIDSERKTLLTSNVIRKIDVESSDIFDVLGKMKDSGVTPAAATETNSLGGDEEDDDDDDDEEDSVKETQSEDEDDKKTIVTPPPTPPASTPPPAPVKATRGRQKTTTVK